jgi:hypothetical protein
MSLFNPADLLTQNLEANATKRDPLPIGETVAQIMEIDFKDGKAGPQAKNPGAPWYRLNCKLEITDPEYLAMIPGNPEKAITFLGIMLDMDNGNIAAGANKNIRLGKLRDAAGVNGKPLSMLQGQFIRIAIGHKPDSRDPEVIQDEVVSYTKV